MQETVVFFRDDDVGEMTDPLRALLDVLLEFEIPCHYQVVPDYLDAACAGELRRLKRAHPRLLHFNQHGLHHEQEIGGQRCYSEFAGGRSYPDQLRDIQQGRDRLEQSLAEAFTPDVFTPPCHKYDAETLRALADLGFQTLSAGVRVDWPSRLYYAVGRRLGRIDFLGKRVSYHQRRTPDARLAEVSVVIDVHEDQDASGRRRDKGLDELWSEFCAVRPHLDAIGLMTHHQACETPEKQRVFRDLIARLAAEPGVRFAGLSELASSGGPR